MFSRLEPTNSLALWTVDIESGQEARLTSPPPGNSDLRSAWSHDGKWIAFNRWSTASPSRLYLVPAAGGEARALLPEDKISRAAVTWSLDDHQLLFVPGGPWGWRRLGARHRYRENSAAHGWGESQHSSRLAQRSDHLLELEPRDILFQDACCQPGGRARADLAQQGRQFLGASASRRTACGWCFNRVAAGGRCCGFTRWQQVRSASSPIPPPDGRTECRTGRPMASASCFSRTAMARSSCGSGMSMAGRPVACPIRRSRWMGIGG